MKKFNLSFFLLQNEELKVQKNVCEDITSSNFVDILLLGLSPPPFIYKIHSQHDLRCCVASAFEVKLGLKK